VPAKSVGVVPPRFQADCLLTPRALATSAHDVLARLSGAHLVEIDSAVVGAALCRRDETWHRSKHHRAGNVRVPSKGKPRCFGPGVHSLGGSVMTVVLLVCVLASAMGAWLAHRHRRQIAWNRELDAAFAGSDRQELPPPRGL